MSNLEKTIAKAFLEMAEGLETGSFGPRPRIALTGMGSEHGEENVMAAAVAAARPPTPKIEAKPSSTQTIISRRFLVRFFTNLEPLRAYLSKSGSVWKMISLPSRRPNRFLWLFRVILKHTSFKRIDHMRFLILIIPFLLSAVRHMHMPMQKKLRFVLLH